MLLPATKDLLPAHRPPPPLQPSAVAWGSALDALASSWLLLWVGSWFGVDGAAQLAPPAEPLRAAAGCLAWTAPYVGATLAAHAVAAPLMRQPVRHSAAASEAATGGRRPAAGAAALLGAVAYSQVAVWQGLWLQAALALLGAPSFAQRLGSAVLDPALYSESVAQSSMGALAPARLPLLLAAPLACAGVGVMEGGWCAAG